MKLKHLKTLSLLIIFVMCFSVLFEQISAPVYAEPAKVRIGHARTGENGGYNNKAGDQTGREVCITKWYYRPMNIQAAHWEYVLRAKNPDTGRALAAKMIEACNNDHIGYDLNSKQRATLYTEAKKHGWNISAIDKNCETTCAGVISVCLNAVGIRVPKYWSSNSIVSDLKKTGLFYVYTSAEYTQSSDKLVVGDILVNEGRSHKHSAMVVESPHPFLYSVDYIGDDGEKHTAEIPEKAEIVFNANNGGYPEAVICDSYLDLTGKTAEKKGFRFVGWRKVSRASFSAVYRSKKAVVKTTADTVKIR